MHHDTMPLKLFCLNIEGKKHIDRFIPFIKAYKPDVVCFQEIFKSDAADFAQELSMQHDFTPMTQNGDIMGIAILSPLPFSNDQHYYFGSLDTLPHYIHDEQQNRALLVANITKDSTTYTIATTHFTWTHDGQADDHQRKDIMSLLSHTKKYSDLILCGDFNAPRGLEIFTKLASEYTDNIPEKYTTSIDGNLHRKGQLNLMVDGLFTTPKYIAQDVELINGLSDHCAIIANIYTTS